MSFKIFLRDINVSNARNALYTLGSSSPRFPADSTSMTALRRSEADRSQSDTRIGHNFELTQSIKPSKQVKCMLASKDLGNDVQVENSAKMQNAGNRIFVAAMLYSWRKQRALIKELSKQLEELQRNTMKHDHRIHVYEKMYDNERERNYDLRAKFRECQEDLKSVRAKHDSLAGANISLKASVGLLEQQLSVREEQYEGLQIAFNEMQTSLFRSMSKERELQRQLSDEQRRLQSYIARENDLKAKILEVRNYDDSKEQNLCDQISLKQLALMRYKQDNQMLTVSINALLVKKREIEGMDSRIQNTVTEIMEIKNDIQLLRGRLEHSWSNRLKGFWRTTTLLRRRIAETVLTVAICVLPGMPLPINPMVTLLPLQIGYA